MTEARLVRQAREIFTIALRECSVDRAYDEKLHVTKQEGRTYLRMAGETIDLNGVRRLRLVAAGKAAAEMMVGFLSRVPIAADCELEGVLIGSRRPPNLPSGIQFFAGGHPLPNQASLDGASAALAMVRKAAVEQDALCLFFFSGGASAMTERPLAAEITLAETAAFYQALVHSGATIAEINCVRKHFSAVKGGRLGRAAGKTPSLTLLVSDVPPQHLDSLASGPTIPDPTTITECREILSRYALLERFPRSIQEFFSSASLPETPKPNAVPTRIAVLLDSEDLAAAAGRYAKTLGYHVVVDHTCDDWPYDEAARYLLSRIRILRAQHGKVCLLSAGEVTVSVPPSLLPGLTHVGGRNQHFALYCASLLGATEQHLAVLSAGSDGIDGNSVAAGAVVNPATLRDAERAEGARQALAQFDSSTFLSSCGATVVTGPTGNNLRDLRVLLAEPGF